MSNQHLVRFRALIMGCPGSGKGTLTKKLMTRFGGGPISSSTSTPSTTTRSSSESTRPTFSTPPPHNYIDLIALSSGDLLRKHIVSKTPIGREIQDLLGAGALIPDAIMTQLMLQELEGPYASRNWILDGFPRTLGQAQSLDAFLSRTQQPPLNLILNLDVPQSVIIDRITSRWIHPTSGRTYHLTYNPPKVEGRDDVTGEPLVQRSDDTVAILKSRLKAYDHMTVPLLEYYAKGDASSGTHRLKTLTGSTSDEIYPKLEAVVEECLLQSAKS